MSPHEHLQFAHILLFWQVYKENQKQRRKKNKKAYLRAISRNNNLSIESHSYNELHTYYTHTIASIKEKKKKIAENYFA